jgi:hypothetical protein
LTQVATIERAALTIWFARQREAVGGDRIAQQLGDGGKVGVGQVGGHLSDMVRT